MTAVGILQIGIEARPPRGADRIRGVVAEDRRHSRQLDRFLGGARAGMRQVDRHTNVVHPLHDLEAGRLHVSRTPFFSVLTDPTFGGVSASLALMADVNIAEPGAAIGFTGARVIKQATYADLPKGFQSAEFQLTHGQVDMVVPRTELRRRLIHLLELYR